MKRETGGDESLFGMLMFRLVCVVFSGVGPRV